MSIRDIKSFIGALVLLAYVSIGVFGLLQVGHHETMVPMNDCPYALGSQSVCDNGLSHINNWKQFSSFVFPTIFVISLLFLAVFLYFFDRNKFLRQNLRLVYQWAYSLDDKFSCILRRKINKWLSLFENSPPYLKRA